MDNFNHQYDAHWIKITTQIWWLTNMEYNTFEVVVVVLLLLLLSFDVFVPTSAHPLLFMNSDLSIYASMLVIGVGMQKLLVVMMNI